jgi:L-fucose isomerase-like protein
MKQKVTLGLIVGNRAFFPSHLAKSGRATILKVLKKEGIDVVALDPEETEYGSVVTLADAHKCADLFKAHRDEIDGILITLPNFGEERGIVDTLRLANLNVPVLVHAFPDDVQKMSLQDRRDSFCGKMSACNNLRQYGIKFSLTSLHTVDPESELSGRSAPVRRHLPWRWAEKRTAGGDRRPPKSLQYRALQRKVA